MSGSTQGSKDDIDLLLAALDEAIELLNAAGDDHWWAWLSRDRAMIAGGDAYGFAHVLSAFGGMGSINDKYYYLDSEIRPVLSRIHLLAARLKRDGDRRDGVGRGGVGWRGWFRRWMPHRSRAGRSGPGRR